MASIVQPNISTFNAGATIVKGHAVKMSSDSVVECTANTDRAIGIAQNSAASGEKVEVAMPGGGGKFVASETIGQGLSMVPHTDGTAAKANAEGDKVIAIALEDGVAGDLMSVMVCKLTAHAADE